MTSPSDRYSDVEQSQDLYKFADGFTLRPRSDGSYEIILRDGTYAEVGSWFPSILSDLHALDGFRFERFCAELQRQSNRPSSRSVWLQLRVAGIIEPFEERLQSDLSCEAEYPWKVMGWGPAVPLHEASALASFVQDDSKGWADTARFGEAIASVDPGPPPTKSTTAVPLEARDPLGDPEPAPSVDFFSTLLKRRTCRSFAADTTVSRDQLVRILHFAAREHGILRNPHYGQHILRTSPSGGARHPVEIYPQVIRVNETAPGSYYYDSLKHEIVRLGDVSPNFIGEIGQNQKGCINVPLSFIVTARFARNLWKYRYAKSFLFTYLDVGHLVQTLILCCEAVGLRTFITPAIDVAATQRHLNLKNIYDECAVYLVCVG